MIYFDSIDELINKCVYHTTIYDEVDIVVDSKMALDLVNELIKNYKCNLIYADVVLDGESEDPVLLEMDRAGNIAIADVCDGEYEENRIYYIADKFPVEIINGYKNGMKAVRFKISKKSDYSICIDDDKKGFCYCRNVGNSEYKFTYHANKPMTHEEIYKIINKYGRSFTNE